MENTLRVSVLLLVVGAVSGALDCVCYGNKYLHFLGYNLDRIDFRGDCRYTLAELKDTTNLCYFHVIIENWSPTPIGQLGGRAEILHVDVVFGPDRMRISMSANRHIRVSDWRHMAPMKFPVTGKGTAVLIQTGLGLMFRWPDCGIQVTVDQDLNPVVYVDSTMHRNKVHGICGTCNGVKNEYPLKDGNSVVGLSPAVRSRQIAESFLIQDYVIGRFHQCSTVLINPVCDVPMENKAASLDYCGKIRNILNVFATCINSIDKNIQANLYEDCKQDVCSFLTDEARQKTASCNVLQIMSRVCAGIGRPVSWRSDSFCPLSCPGSSTFSSSTSGCPLSCGNDQTDPLLACGSIPDSEGCVCPSGHIVDSGKDYCVEDAAGCGCTVNNRYFSQYAVYIVGSASEVKYCKPGSSQAHFTDQVPCVNSGEISAIDSYGFGYCTCPEGYNYGTQGQCSAEISCASGSYFTISLNSCTSTCRNPTASSSPGCSSTSTAGCTCEDGKLYDEDLRQCVVNTYCGCYDQNGNNRPVGTEWLSNNCKTLHVCVIDNNVPTIQSTSHPQPANSYCDVSGPNYVCYKYFLPVAHNDRRCEQPITCPANGHYSPVAPSAGACRPTCANPDRTCPAVRNHGCKCLPGYYFTNDAGTGCDTCDCMDAGTNVHSTDERIWNSDCSQLSWCQVRSGALDWVTEAKTCGLYAHCDTTGAIPKCVCNLGYIEWLDSDVNGGGDCIPVSPTCGENKQYNPESSACPSTCSLPTNADSCNDKEPACECLPGYLLATVGGDCILAADCVCIMPDGHTINIGEKAFDANCTMLWECKTTAQGTVLTNSTQECGAFALCNDTLRKCECLDTYLPTTATEAYGDDCEPPIVCGDSEEYDPLTSACPNTCTNRTKEDTCSSPDEAACRCLSTHWRESDSANAACVPKTQCGCLHPDSTYRPVGDSWINLNCTTTICTNVNGTPIAIDQGEGCPLYTECNATDPNNPVCVCGTGANGRTRYILTTDVNTGYEWCQREVNICSASQSQLFNPFDFREDNVLFKRHGDCTWTMMEVIDQSDRCFVSATLKAKTLSTDPPFSFKWIDHVKIVVGKDRNVIIFTWNLQATVDGVDVVYDQNNNNDYWLMVPPKLSFDDRVIIKRTTGRSLSMRWDGCGDIRVNFIQTAQYLPTVYFRNLGTVWHNRLWGICGNGNTNKYDVELVTHGTQYNVSNMPGGVKWLTYVDSFRLPDPDCTECANAHKVWATGAERCGKLTDKSGPYATCIPYIVSSQNVKAYISCEYAVCEYFETDKFEMFKQMCEAYDMLNTECSNQGISINYIPYYCSRCVCRRPTVGASSVYNTFDGLDKTVSDGSVRVMSAHRDPSDACYYKFEVGFQYIALYWQPKTLKATVTSSETEVYVDEALHTGREFQVDGTNHAEPYSGIPNVELWMTNSHAFLRNVECGYQIYINFQDVVIVVDPATALFATGFCGSCNGVSTDD